jgi:hypothetical protein
MKLYALLLSCGVLVGCASISGTQSFATVDEYALPAVGTIVGSQTVTAQGATKTRSFAQAVLDNLDQLRANKHVDSAGVSIRIVSTALTTDTTFSGVEALRTQLVTETGTIDLCNHTLTASEQRSSNVECSADFEIDETMLRAADAPAQIRVQLVLAGDVTATKLISTVTFEAQLDADLSL